MTVDQINITLGTAGHIDHGKTALVKCFTGCETDRLKEEKERGMSIDLGFAPCTVADMQVGIVDVPGHENFVKTMVAGAGGMDGVILVVAADDGVMPQTREHLDILTLLGIRHGLVALTKIDRVDAEHRRVGPAETGRLRPRHVPGRGADPAAVERHRRGLRRLLRGPGRPGRLDPARSGPTACSACRSSGRSPCRATAPWWPAFPWPAPPAPATKSSSCPAGPPGASAGSRSTAAPATRCWPASARRMNVGHWDHHAIHRGDTRGHAGLFRRRTSGTRPRLRLLPRDQAAR